jgi:hypothetical protein
MMLQGELAAVEVEGSKEEHLLMAFPEGIPAQFYDEERFEVEPFDVKLSTVA